MPAINSESDNLAMLLGDVNSNLEPRIGVMFGILFISLFGMPFMNATLRSVILNYKTSNI